MTWDPSGHYHSAHPQGPFADRRPSVRERFRRWPMPAKVAAIGCAVPLVLFVLLVVFAVILVLLGFDSDEGSAAERGPIQAAEEVETPTPDASAESEEPSASPSEEPSEEATEPSPTPSATRASQTPSQTPAPSSTPTQTPTPSSPAPSPAVDSSTHTAVVSRVIDGDTVELASGERVRLLGIDTPERGECHFDTASDAMAGLVLGERVTLTRDGDDRDHYDRLLRYIDVGSADAGLTLIQEGLAIARYDSRDGYGFHTREPAYIAAEQASAQQTCAEVVPEPAQPAPAVPQPEADCDPNYTPCVPPYPPDINCSDISFPVRVIGSDPHGFDADGDGFGCEANG